MLLLAQLLYSRKAGKVRAIGCSAMYGFQLHNMQDAAEKNGWTKFSTMQNHYNLLYREDEHEVVPVCRQYGMSLIPFSPLAAGHLSRRTWNSDSKRSQTDAVAVRKYDRAKEYDLRIVERVANLAEKYGKLAEEIYAAILREYFSPNGRLCVDTQTAYLLCLNFGVYVDKDRLIEGLKKRFQKDCFKIKGGFVGATMMCRVLAENGMENLASYFLFQEGFPGWLHCVDLGATTIWERWNSVLDAGSISGTGMNSLNHYSYGSVMEYVFRDLAGIQPLEPGFGRVRFAPQPTWKAGNLAFSYDSIRGTYASSWQIREDGTLSVRFQVPFGCTAEAMLPGTDEIIELTAGVYEKTYQPACDYRLKYCMNSRLDEMKDDPEAVAILQADLPAAYELIQTQDAEFLTMSLNDLQFLFFRGFNPQMVREGARRLLTLKA